MPSPGTQPGVTAPSSFFNAAIERALAVIDQKGDGRILIISGRNHTALIIEACQKYSANELSRMILIPEPEAKNTAPAIACAVNYIDWMSGEERKVLVLTSDHIITPIERFIIDAAAAEAFVQADKLVVFGIKPQWPETGYGYIETGQIISQMKEIPEVFKVLSFHEKPDKEKAEKFLVAGNFFWNSGMFAFSSKFILNEYRRSAPDLLRPFDKLRAPGETSFKTEYGLRILFDWLNLDAAYKETQTISFDCAIAEKCSHTIVVSAGFNWRDVGNWDEYALLAGRNGSINGEVYQINSRNCFVDSDIPVALIGTENLIVAVRSGKNGGPGSVLVTKRGETQHVREIVAQIRAKGRNELL
jgi:mannose-1-phosphate guanylyltransferase/mannose-1-phosphate guanylyltransferase/mannose-6-phosphate isomerase